MLSETAARWFEEVWNQRNLDVISQLTHDNVKGHMEGGVEITSFQPFLEFREQLLRAIPDFRVEVLKAISQGDTASVLWRVTGKHTGDGMGFKPTQRALVFTGSTWFRFEGGKIAEAWDCWNQAALFQLLGQGGGDVK